MKKIILSLLTSTFLLLSCGNATNGGNTNNSEKDSTGNVATNETVQTAKNTNQQIIDKPQVPILCYHRLEAGRKDEYSMAPDAFEAQVKALQDSGYHSISPDQLYDYLVYNKTLPEKPVMFTFDDSRIEHINIAAPVLEKHGFKGVFFIMTITYNKKNYMSTDQIAELAKRGHTIGLHSWDHTMATKYKTPEDWEKQVEDPKKKLEEIIGQPVNYWAFPNGVNNEAADSELSKYFKLSFILSTKRDVNNPLQSVRRMIIPGWSAQATLKAMRETFKNKHI